MTKIKASFSPSWDVVFTRAGAQHVPAGTGSLGRTLGDEPEIGVVLRNAKLHGDPDVGRLQAAADLGRREFSAAFRAMVQIGDSVKIAA